MDEEPDPHDGDRELPKPDDKGTLDPQALKQWRYFERTRDFLRQRYSEHGILAGPALTFDCLVPKFQKPLDIPADKRKQYKLPRKGDPPERYEEALRMLVTSQGEVGFVCSSEECQRTRCKLNLRNEKRLSPCDLYSLIQIFHGHRSVAKALAIVAEEFGKLGKFAGARDRGKAQDHPVRRPEARNSCPDCSLFSNEAAACPQTGGRSDRADKVMCSRSNWNTLACFPTTSRSSGRRSSITTSWVRSTGRPSSCTCGSWSDKRKLLAGISGAFD